MLAGFAINSTIDILEKVGNIAASKLIDQLLNWPKNQKDAEKFYINLKKSTLIDLTNFEENINKTLIFFMKNRNMSAHDELADIRNEINKVKDKINKSGSDTYSNVIKEIDIFKTLSIIYTTIQYDCMILVNEAQQLNDKVLYDKDYSVHLKDLRKGMTNLNNTWNLRISALSDPASSKAIYNELKSNRKKFVEMIENVTSKNKNEMEEIFSGVVLSKPKFFGKNRYKKELEDFIWKFVSKFNITSIGLDELEFQIKDKNPLLNFDFNLLEEIVSGFIENKKAFSLSEQGNKKIIEFKKSELSQTCGNCGDEGGIFKKFRRCENTNSLICSNCITFLKKCKLCGDKIKNKHIVVK